MSILIIMDADVNINGRMHYELTFNLIPDEVYVALRDKGFFHRLLAKCATPAGCTYWAQVCNVSTGMPNLLPGHKVLEPWSDPRICDVWVGPSSTIQAPTNVRSLSANVSLRRRPCGCGKLNEPEENHAKLHDSAGSARLVDGVR